MINGSLPVRERNIPTDLKEAGYKETLMDEDMSYSSYLWFYGDFIQDNPDYDIKIIFSVLDDKILATGEETLRVITGDEKTEGC